MDCFLHSSISAVYVVQVLLLENTRFHAGDTENDDAFAEALIKSTGAEVFVMDAFGVSHRNQASVTVIACPSLVEICVRSVLGGLAHVSCDKKFLL